MNDLAVTKKTLVATMSKSGRTAGKRLVDAGVISLIEVFGSKLMIAGVVKFLDDTAAAALSFKTELLSRKMAATPKLTDEAKGELLSGVEELMAQIAAEEAAKAAQAKEGGEDATPEG